MLREIALKTFAATVQAAPDSPAEPLSTGFLIRAVLNANRPTTIGTMRASEKVLHALETAEDNKLASLKLDQALWAHLKTMVDSHHWGMGYDKNVMAFSNDVDKAETIDPNGSGKADDPKRELKQGKVFHPGTEPPAAAPDSATT